MTSAPVIVEADLTDPEHQRAIRDLLNAYSREPLENGADLPADVLDRLIPGLRQHPTTFVLLAYADRPVGIAVCFRSFSTFAARPVINIHDLFVERDFRGRGIGRQLIDGVEAEARRTGCAALTLEVRDDNEAAQRLYRKAGFSDVVLASGPKRFWFWQKRLQRAPTVAAR